MATASEMSIASGLSILFIDIQKKTKVIKSGARINWNFRVYPS